MLEGYIILILIKAIPVQWIIVNDKKIMDMIKSSKKSVLCDELVSSLTMSEPF